MTIAARPLPARALPPRQTQTIDAAALAPNAVLTARRDVGSSSALFTIDLDAPISGYRPGQYVALGLTGAQGFAQRPYSVVSVGPGRRQVELLIRRVAGGAVSPLLWQLPMGARIRVGPPRGLFALDGAGDQARLFVGAGTGVAPLLAMIEQTASGWAGRRATLVHAVSYADELVFGQRIQRWRRNGLDLRYLPTISRPDEPENRGWAGDMGRAEAQLARLVTRSEFAPLATVAYVCGNPAMVDSCSTLLHGAGVPDNAIRVERF